MYVESDVCVESGGNSTGNEYGGSVVLALIVVDVVVVVCVVVGATVVDVEVDVGSTTVVTSAAGASSPLRTTRNVTNPATSTTAAPIPTNNGVRFRFGAAPPSQPPPAGG